MRELNPNIDLHELIGQQIFDSLQGEIVEPIRQQCEGTGYDVYYRSIKEGMSLKVESTLLPDVYNLCQQVVRKLEYAGDVDFYITGNTDVNACSYASADDSKPNIVEINSGLFNLMNEEELKFVIGHEIGHLINRDTVISRLFNFIYPADNKEKLEACPTFLTKRYKLYQQLAELGADRYGFMANENLEACVTAIFKLASGLFLEKMNVSMESLISENKKRLEYFTQENGISDGTHPVNPIRVRAIELFATAKTQKALNQGMREMVDILQTFVYTEIDRHLADFIAAAGLIVTQADSKADKIEEEYILSHLASFCIFPKAKLKEIKKSENIMDTMAKATVSILDIDPGMREALLNYFIDVAYSDKTFKQEEISLIYNFGSLIKFSTEEISKAMGIKICEHLVPNASVLG